MRYTFSALLIFTLCLYLCKCSNENVAPESPNDLKSHSLEDHHPWEADFFYQWVLHEFEWTGFTRSNISLPSYLRGSAPGIARRYHIVHGCAFDAMNAYSRTSVPIYIDHPKIYFKSTGPPWRRVSQQKETITYALYRCSLYAHPLVEERITELFESLGYDPSITTTDPKTPAGVGNLIASLHIETAKNDGTNSEGTHPNSNGTPFSDYVEYPVVNDPFPQVGITTCSQIRDFNLWQPARFRRRDGSTGVQLPWNESVFSNTKTLMLTSALEFIAPPIPLYNTSTQEEFIAGYDQILNEFATLGDYEKVLARHWQGGQSTTVTPKMALYASNSARIRQLSLEDTVSLIFMAVSSSYHGELMTVANKRYYNAPRPTNVIQCLYADEFRDSWRGPYLGVGQMNISEWKAYVPITQVQNAGPEYPAGAMNSAIPTGQVMRLFFETDEFIGYPVVYPEGSDISLEPRIDEGEPGYIPGITDVPNSGYNTVGYSPATNITLFWNTWTELVESVFWARLYLGVHLLRSGENTLEIGNRIGSRVYNVVQGYLQGEYPEFQIRRYCEAITSEGECKKRGRDYCKWESSCIAS